MTSKIQCLLSFIRKLLGRKGKEDEYESLIKREAKEERIEAKRRKGEAKEVKWEKIKVVGEDVVD